LRKRAPIRAAFPIDFRLYYAVKLVTLLAATNRLVCSYDVTTIIEWTPMPNWRFPEFDWDDGNIDHIIDGHGIYPDEVESVFYNRPLVIRQGMRFYVIGQDENGQYLFVVCEARGRYVRVVTARPADRSERRRYEREQ
jgi:uncharacterized DUF497 family protein